MVVGITIAALVALPGADEPVAFVDVTADCGINHIHHPSTPVPGLFEGQTTRMGYGAAVSDYDRDGDQDVYIVDSYGWPNQLYRNDGDGSFTNVTEAAGVGDRNHSHMALFLDLDNDGFDDLLVINDYIRGGHESLFRPSQLYRNRGDGTFVNVSAGSGFEPVDSTIGGATAGDYDHDGDLDLFVTGWYNWSTHLYRNDGNFRFTDVTDAAGARPEGVLSQFTPIFVDVDGDGWQDIFCAVDFLEDYLLHNNGDGTFTDYSLLSGVRHGYNDMGVAIADIDGDLDLDIYTTNITGGVLCDVEGGCNMLYLNDGTGRFSDGTAAFGLGDTAWGWGTWFFDADLDGRRELMAVNGWSEPPFDETPANFFYANEAGVYEDRAAAFGIAHVGNTRSLLPFDLEGDGDLDLILGDVLGTAVIYENQSPRDENHWVVVKAEGRLSNRNGVGSRVYVTAGGQIQMQEVFVGGSFYSGPPLETHFGIGSAGEIEKILVVFPSGHRVRLCGADVDQRIVVVEPDVTPCAADIDGNRAVDLADLVAVLSQWGACPGCCAADIDDSANVDLGDLLTVLGNFGDCAP